MRIAYVTDEAYPGFGGQATATEAHVRALADLGHELHVVVGRQRAQSEPPAGVRLSTLPVFPLGSLSHIALPRKSVLVPVLDWADIVHINLPGPLAATTMRLARRRGLPVVMGLHIQEQNTSMHLLGPLRPILEGILHRFYRRLFGEADCVTAPTAFAGRLAGSYAPPRIEVVSNGLDPFTEDPGFDEEVDTLRRELLAGGDDVVLTYVGRLYPEKHPEELVALLAAARERGSKSVLAVAGRGPLSERMLELARRAGVADHVRLLGFVQERRKRALLRATDVFLMPSEVELQSIATMEAMSAGCPILTADYPTSAVPELVKECGAGVAYPAGRPDRGAQILMEMLADEGGMTRYRRAARVSAGSFELPAIGRRLAAIYEELIAGRGTPGAARRPRDRRFTRDEAPLPGRS
jgi:glycosyltransferase involved in cell wall biosynthesis